MNRQERGHSLSEEAVPRCCCRLFITLSFPGYVKIKYPILSFIPYS